MRVLPIAPVLSAVAVLTLALTVGCTGDDNTLPLLPSDASTDATQKDGSARDAPTVKLDAGEDASGSEGWRFEPGADAVEATQPDTSGETTAGDASDSG